MSYLGSDVALLERCQSCFLILLGVDDGISGLFVFVSLLLSDSLLGLSPDSFEHGSVLEHRGHNHESDLTASEVDLLNWHGSAIFMEHGDIVESDIHGIFGIGKESSKHLT